MFELEPIDLSHGAVQSRFFNHCGAFLDQLQDSAESPDVHQDLCFRLTAVTIGPDGI
jgi:hypothetical protein